MGCDRRSHFWWDSYGPIDFYPVTQFSAALLSFCQTDCQPALRFPERRSRAFYCSGQRKENKNGFFPPRATPSLSNGEFHCLRGWENRAPGNRGDLTFLSHWQDNVAKQTQISSWAAYRSANHFPGCSESQELLKCCQTGLCWVFPSLSNTGLQWCEMKGYLPTTWNGGEEMWQWMLTYLGFFLWHWLMVQGLELSSDRWESRFDGKINNQEECKDKERWQSSDPI